MSGLPTQAVGSHERKRADPPRRRATLAALLAATLILASACSGGGGGGGGGSVWTPDDVVTGVVPVGERVTLQGTVRAITLKTHMTGNLSFEVEGQRYVLLGVGATEGLSERQAQWGVGAVWPAEKLSSRQWELPHEGDVIRATGIVSTEDCVRESCYTLDGIEGFSIVESDVPALADIGGACDSDMDCRDDLFCDRDSRRCAAFAEPIEWGSRTRDVNGSCEADADCPIGQFCDPSYTIQGEGPYAAPYLKDFVVGRHLCQPYDREVPAEEVCPRFATVHDVLGGRFAQGKEVCLEGTIWIAVFNPGDRDTHVQYRIPLVKVYPLSLPPVDPFGMAVENVPSYKDPSNPSGRLGDPLAGQRVAHVGTVRFDEGHGWYELHPVKFLRLLDPETGRSLPPDRGPGPAPPPAAGLVWPSEKSIERGASSGEPGG